MNFKDQPLVSVLMTSYNREKYIAEAIESVLNSTYRNFELIIVDDCSKDKTVALASNYANRDNRVKLFINQQNLGDYPNRNKAASYANGFLMMYVDSDDSITPDAIEYVVKNFKENASAKFSLIYTQKDISKPTVLTSHESIYRNFFNKQFLNIGPGGTIIQTQFFKSIGGFPEKYGPANDMYYNLKVASNTNILLLPCMYLNYRIHDGQEINNKYSYLYNNYRYLFDAMQLPELPLTQSQKKTILRSSARDSIFSLLIFFKKTMKIGKTIKAYKLSGIRLKDLI